MNDERAKCWNCGGTKNLVACCHLCAVVAKTQDAALNPTPAASQVTLNCARCVQNGETAANVAGATCGRCGNATPATSPPTPAASSGLAAEFERLWGECQAAYDALGGDDHKCDESCFHFIPLEGEEGHQTIEDTPNLRKHQAVARACAVLEKFLYGEYGIGKGRGADVAAALKTLSEGQQR